MNTVAYEENLRNKRHITRTRDALIVDTQHILFKGFPWRSLGAFGRRKFENVLFLGENGRLKIAYV